MLAKRVERKSQVRWVDARLQELLPIPYFHCVFTLPHTLNPLAQGNPHALYGPALPRC